MHGNKRRHVSPRADDLSLLTDEPVTRVSATGIEKGILLQALEKAGGSKTQAAHLGITLRSMRYKLEKCGMD